VIDYKTQQSRLFPLLASAYAFRFVGEWLKWLYTDVTQRLQANDFSTLPEAHACTAGLKSLTTTATAVCNYHWHFSTKIYQLVSLFFKRGWVLLSEGLAILRFHKPSS
jgi:hypothetical protein